MFIISSLLKKLKIKSKIAKIYFYLILFIVSFFLLYLKTDIFVFKTYSNQDIKIPENSFSNSKYQLWSSQFNHSKWLMNWGKISRSDWGLENLEIKPDFSQKFEQILRVHYPANSASPTVSELGNPLGGAQFYANLKLPPQEALLLSYYVRFSDDFQFVKGGKLPGLFGGQGNNGGDIPDGTDGFSTRYMWRRNGEGEIYAYLPTSENYGTSIGRGSWRFDPGEWYYLQQEVILNQPNQANGSIRVWVNGKEVIHETELIFRTVDHLKIDGILFSTFFGGGDLSWVTPRDVYADFAEFSVYSIDSVSKN